MGCDIRLDDALDRTLEDGAKQHNLTVVNVRNILHVSGMRDGGVVGKEMQPEHLEKVLASLRLSLSIPLDFINSENSDLFNLVGYAMKRRNG